MTTLREAAQQALEFCEFLWREVVLNDWAEGQRGAAESALRAALAEPVPEPVQQALVEADRIMGHDDEATEWRERWAHLFGVAGSATSPWRESAAQGCSLGGTGMPATPPQRPAEPMVWTTQFDINWALNNPGRAGSFYANKEGSNDIALYTTPPVCGRVTEPVQEPVAWRWGYRSITTGEMDWRGYVEIPAHPNLRSPAIIMEALYTFQPQRKPLTEEKIMAVYTEFMLYEEGLTSSGLQRVARAIERAHGIGDNT